MQIEVVDPPVCYCFSWIIRVIGNPHHSDYPLVVCYIAMENGLETVNFPLNSMMDLSIVFCKRLPEGKSNKSNSIHYIYMYIYIYI